MPVSPGVYSNLEPAHISSILNTGVAATVDYVRKQSPFYIRKFANAPVVSDIEDLVQLPITTKKEVSQCNEDFWCGPQDRFSDFCTTSGTTGVPTLYPLNTADLDRLAYNESLCFEHVGLMPGDVVILAVTIDKCFMAGLAYMAGLRRLGVAAVRVGAGSPAMLLSMVDRLKATAIVSVPSFLSRVAAYATQQGINPALSTVKKLVCIGEPIRNSDWGLTTLGSHISRSWNAQLFSTYGVTELACSLCECQAGSGGHLHPELLHIEILDDAGSAVRDGDIGQLVATTIGVQTMPLVRFATGDMTFVVRERCACGRYTPRIGPIVGRKDQAMKIKGTTVYPAAVQRTLQSIEQIADYVMIATAPTPLSDELEVVVAIRGAAAGVDEIIREKLRGDLKVVPTVRITDIKEILSLGHPTELRKQRVFLDRRRK